MPAPQLVHLVALDGLEDSGLFDDVEVLLKTSVFIHEVSSPLIDQPESLE